ncbi:PIN domain-containing protein [uncultured Methylobacterium sp.]|uniref:PIN domain-containing protein n=1 Tax=uncultured Methylobacterium sp. TaxID=157278 RepID=UPI0035CBC957
MIGLDTNLLVRLFANDSPDERARVIALLDALPSGETAYVNVLVVAELIWTLRRAYGFEPHEIASVLRRLTEHPRISTEADLLREAAHRSREEGGDVADQLIALINRARGCRTTFTFDRDAGRSTDFSPVP